ncbi:GIN domain-containing protein [Pedobacter sp. UC225_65]|uniref:GIN domain-containing protein n=1 Tax=Pedobacter sp. UC225_65 TaxID=3350173 RepID=UPI00366D6EF8
MKTSNKLLITFALALTLIPLIGMVYDAKVNYTDDKGYAIEESNRAKEDANFNTPSKNMESKVIAAPFQSVNIEDAKKIGINIHYVKAEQYGVKVSKGVKDSIDFKVDANGQLQISFKDKTEDKDSYYISILVYAPTLKQLNINNTKALFVNAQTDSLDLNVNNSGVISFDKDAVIGKLNINAENVDNVNAWESNKITNLYLNLKNSDFTSTRSTFENLSINSSVKSEIEIFGENGGKTPSLIKNLVLNTLDVANVKLENVKVANCSGNLSDQTQVQMPAINLNQMYKAKK